MRVWYAANFTQLGKIILKKMWLTPSWSNYPSPCCSIQQLLMKIADVVLECYSFRSCPQSTTMQQTHSFGHLASSSRCRSPSPLRKVTHACGAIGMRQSEIKTEETRAALVCVWLSGGSVKPRTIILYTGNKYDKCRAYACRSPLLP